jgi:hypothetical protein
MRGLVLVAVLVGCLAQPEMISEIDYSSIDYSEIDYSEIDSKGCSEISPCRGTGEICNNKQQCVCDTTADFIKVGKDCKYVDAVAGLDGTFQIETEDTPPTSGPTFAPTTPPENSLVVGAFVDYYDGIDADRNDEDQSDRTVGVNSNIEVFGPEVLSEAELKGDDVAATANEGVVLPIEGYAGETIDTQTKPQVQGPAFIFAAMVCCVLAMFAMFHAKNRAASSTKDSGATSEPVQVENPAHWSTMPHASLI